MQFFIAHQAEAFLDTSTKLFFALFVVSMIASSSLLEYVFILSCSDTLVCSLTTCVDVLTMFCCAGTMIFSISSMQVLYLLLIATTLVPATVFTTLGLKVIHHARSHRAKYLTYKPVDHSYIHSFFALLVLYDPFRFRILLYSSCNADGMVTS